MHWKQPWFQMWVGQAEWVACFERLWEHPDFQCSSTSELQDPWKLEKPPQGVGIPGSLRELCCFETLCWVFALCPAGMFSGQLSKIHANSTAASLSRIGGLLGNLPQSDTLVGMALGFPSQLCLMPRTLPGTKTLPSWALRHLSWSFYDCYHLWKTRTLHSMTSRNLS